MMRIKIRKKLKSQIKTKRKTKGIKILKMKIMKKYSGNERNVILKSMTDLIKEKEKIKTFVNHDVRKNLMDLTQSKKLRKIIKMRRKKINLMCKNQRRSKSIKLLVRSMNLLKKMRKILAKVITIQKKRKRKSDGLIKKTLKKRNQRKVKNLRKRMMKMIHQKRKVKNIQTTVVKNQMIKN